ncbi:MAG: hypothetical protein RJA31_1079, partial [Actinomycetota bacterium]
TSLSASMTESWSALSRSRLTERPPRNGAFVLEAVGEFRTAFFGDTTVNEHVDEVGADVPKNSRVVRDEQNAEAGVLLDAIDTFGDDFERVDID